MHFVLELPRNAHGFDYVLFVVETCAKTFDASHIVKIFFKEVILFMCCLLLIGLLNLSIIFQKTLLKIFLVHNRSTLLPFTCRRMAKLR